MAAPRTFWPSVCRTLFLLFSTVAATETYRARIQLMRPQRTFEIEVHPEWAPIGALRFHEMVSAGVLDSARVFRVVPKFMVQMGIAAKPSVARFWRDHPIPDDRRMGISNTRGTVTFAMSGRHSRTTQFFINTVDNPGLDGQGFTPFGRVTGWGDGMAGVGAIYEGYRERPQQGRIQSEGNAYLDASFPKLTYIEYATLIEPPTTTTTAGTPTIPRVTTTALPVRVSSSSLSAARAGSGPSGPVETAAPMGLRRLTSSGYNSLVAGLRGRGLYRSIGGGGGGGGDGGIASPVPLGLSARAVMPLVAVVLVFGAFVTWVRRRRGSASSHKEG